MVECKKNRRKNKKKSFKIMVKCFTLSNSFVMHHGFDLVLWVTNAALLHIFVAFLILVLFPIIKDVPLP